MSASISSKLTERLANFCVDLKYEDLSHEVKDEAKKAILDWLGVALIGSKEESTRIILKACANSESGGGSTILGMAQPGSTTAAMLVNGTAGHALDYDDVQHRCGVHMSAPVLPVAFAL